MKNAIFQVKNVDYWYLEGKPVLNDISFQVHAGERVAMLGANASGKSTLLRLLDGLYFPRRGSILAFDTPITEDSVETPPFSRRFRQNVGLLFQNSEAQLFCATVEEELAFGPLQLELAAGEVECRVDDTLRLFGIEHLRRRSPQMLSGGEQRKVALASLITCGSRVILLDEPSTGLDPRTQQWLIELLDSLHHSGITLITATNDLSFAAEVSDRALVLSEDHRLVCDQPVMDVLHDLNLLMSVNLIHAHAHRHDGAIHLHPHLHQTWHDHSHEPAG